MLVDGERKKVDNLHSRCSPGRQVPWEGNICTEDKVGAWQGSDMERSWVGLQGAEPVPHSHLHLSLPWDLQDDCCVSQ